MVNSISKIVQSIIDKDLSLQDSLQRDYGNYSAIARLIRPKVKEILGQDANLESIITSVKRAKANYKPLRGKITKVVAGSVINIRTYIAKVSVEKTKENLERIRKSLAGFSGEFFLFQTVDSHSQGCCFPEDYREHMVEFVLGS